MENGLKGIKANAFYVNNIVAMQMNENICYVGEDAFYGGDFLETITDIPRNLRKIGDGAFPKANLDSDTIEMIKKINPNAISNGWGAFASLYPSYDYDMKEKPIQNSTFNYENDSEYDNEEYVPTPGNYVNYSYNQNASIYVSSSYTGESTKTFYATKGLKWRILNVDEENGKVDLISDRPTDEILKLNNSAGYNNAVYMMNVICQKLYKSSKYDVSVRNINLKDVEKCMGTNGIQARNNYRSSGYVRYGKAVSYGGKIKYPSLYKNQKGNQIESENDFYPELTKANPDPYEESDELNSQYIKGEWKNCDSYTDFVQTAYELPINYEYFNKGVDLLKSSAKYFISARSLNTATNGPRYGVRCASDSISFINIYGDHDSDGYEVGCIESYGCGDSYSCGDSYGCDEYEDKVAAEAHLRPVVTIDLSAFGDRDENGSWNLK